MSKLSVLYALAVLSCCMLLGSLIYYHNFRPANQLPPNVCNTSIRAIFHANSSNPVILKGHYSYDFKNKLLTYTFFHTNHPEKKFVLFYRRASFDMEHVGGNVFDVRIKKIEILKGDNAGDSLDRYFGHITSGSSYKYKIQPYSKNTYSILADERVFSFCKTM